MKKLSITITILIVLGMLLSACAQAATTPTTKLEEITARGYLIISTDPAYPPQSELVEGGARDQNTKCPTDLHTASELTGFDIDTAVAIAKGIGVEACFTTPDWTLITGGNWANRWDISVGSMTVTPERMEKLYFSQPYYTTPAAFFVHKDNTTLTQPSDLSGRRIGACAGCTYDAYLAGTLQIPGETINFVVTSPEFVGYETDINALQDLALGDGVRLDAVLTAMPTGQGAISDGMPLRQLGDPVYFEYLSAAFDKAGTPDQQTFVEKVNEIINGMLADGSLLTLSQTYYGLDLTTAAGTFDWAALGQFK